MKIYRALIALAPAALLLAVAARAQDMPGIEICTVEKDMVRRTSCLQSNIDFLKKAMTQAASDSQRKIDAAKLRIEALSASVVALQEDVKKLQAAQNKPDASAVTNSSKDTARDGVGESGKDSAKESAR